MVFKSKDKNMVEILKMLSQKDTRFCISTDNVNQCYKQLMLFQDIEIIEEFRDFVKQLNLTLNIDGSVI